MRSKVLSSVMAMALMMPLAASASSFAFSPVVVVASSHHDASYCRNHASNDCKECKKATKKHRKHAKKAARRQNQNIDKAFNHHLDRNYNNRYCKCKVKGCKNRHR